MAVNDTTDQLASLTARWVLPQSGFEVYVEWARNDFSENLTDFLVEPEHSRAYTLGIAQSLASGCRNAPLRNIPMPGWPDLGSIMGHAGHLPFLPRRTDSMAMPLATRRFTVDEYHRMAEVGIFHEDDRVELIHGQVVEMTPIGSGHGSCVNRLTEMFAPLAGRVTLSVQNPVVLGKHEEPQPDFMVLRYRADGYKAEHPHAADVLLVIEVGDTSADSDRRTKIPLYARAGIPEAWLVDLPGDRIRVYRKPAGGQYTDVTTVSRGATLTPLASPSLPLSADQILG